MCLSSIFVSGPNFEIQIIFLSEGGRNNKYCFFHLSDKMDKQVLTSSQASEDVSRYSVGILKEGMYAYILSWFYSI